MAIALLFGYFFYLNWRDRHIRNIERHMVMVLIARPDDWTVHDRLERKLREAILASSQWIYRPAPALLQRLLERIESDPDNEEAHQRFMFVAARATEIVEWPELATALDRMVQNRPGDDRAIQRRQLKAKIR